MVKREKLVRNSFTLEFRHHGLLSLESDLQGCSRSALVRQILDSYFSNRYGKRQQKALSEAGK